MQHAIRVPDGGLAKDRYVVVARNYVDGNCGTARKPQSARPEEPSGKETETWSDATYTDRRADVEVVLDAVLAAKSFEGVPVDAERVGMAGHSRRGRNLESKPSWCLIPFVSKGDLGHLNVPVMFEGGTLDHGITPTVSRAGGAYDRAAPPKYFVEFRRAGHLAWTNLNPPLHGIIDRFGLAFFDRYLKGETNPDPLAALFGKTLPSGVEVERSDVK